MARTASSSPRTLCVNRGRASPQASLQEAERDAQDEDTLRAMRAASEPLQKLWPSEGVWKGVTWSTESGRVDGIRFLQTSQNMEMLPPEIGQLQALTWLDLSGCELTTLPREIGQLRALTWLKLYRSEKQHCHANSGSCGRSSRSISATARWRCYRLRLGSCRPSQNSSSPAVSSCWFCLPRLAS